MVDVGDAERERPRPIGVHHPDRDARDDVLRHRGLDEPAEPLVVGSAHQLPPPPPPPPPPEKPPPEKPLPPRPAGVATTVEASVPEKLWKPLENASALNAPGPT